MSTMASLMIVSFFCVAQVIRPLITKPTSAALPVNAAVPLSVSGSTVLKSVPSIISLAVIYEQVQKIDTEKESWEKRLLTNDITQMVTQLALSKEYTLRYNDLPSGTVLADLGAKDNLIESKLYEIYSEDSAYYYLKLDFIVESNMNHVEREIIRVSVNKIKSLFDINHKRIKTYKLH